MSWYGIDYSSRPVYKFGNHSAMFPKSDPANKKYRNYVARDIKRAKRNNKHWYDTIRAASTAYIPDHVIKEERDSTMHHYDSKDRARRAALLGAGAAGALGYGAYSLYKRHKAKKAARLAAYPRQGF